MKFSLGEEVQVFSTVKGSWENTKIVSTVDAFNAFVMGRVRKEFTYAIDPSYLSEAEIAGIVSERNKALGNSVEFVTKILMEGHPIIAQEHQLRRPPKDIKWKEFIEELKDVKPKELVHVKTDCV